MWPDKRLCELFGIEHPILQAPMLAQSTAELAAAVCNAGGLGGAACAGFAPEAISELAASIRAATNRPFAMNFFAHEQASPDAAKLARARDAVAPWYAEMGLGEPPQEAAPDSRAFLGAHADALLHARPDVASFHFGLPSADVIARLKKAGITLISTATTVAEAKALEAGGIDAIIAQGWEAGGHRGSHEPTALQDGIGIFALVPQIVDAVSVPVIAAGGIADGRGIAAAFALGASGVQIGTAFLTCPEAATGSERRQLIASAADTDTMMTNAMSGRAARAAKSAFAQDMQSHADAMLPFPLMYGLSNPLMAAGDWQDASFHHYGQAAALNRTLPAAELVELLVRETADIFSALG
ncbi:NAD(P)H-dependent flavin oxidoreductase [Oricola sp.]|uniref:NAD(P)H-dependent flavin oxidoreductase n=1 Tax=Oricola sp. TaxID=1979950 RepID=UPI003BA98AAD